MKLSSPAIERSIRKQARRELRESPLLWEDYRQHRTRWWRRNRNLRAALGSAGFLAVLLFAVGSSGRPLALLNVVALYASGTALFRCVTYYGRVLCGYDRAVLIALPVLDDDYLQHETHVFFRSWAGALTVFVLAYGAYATVYGKLWHDWSAVLVAAILQTLTAICIGTAVVAYRPTWAGASTIIPFYGLMIACLYLPEDGLRFLWSATLITPAGWVAHGFAALVGGPGSAERFFLIPAFVVSAALPFAWRRLRSRFAMELASPGDWFETIGAPNLYDTGELAPAADAPGDSQLAHTDLRLAQVLQGRDWDRMGWIERAVGSWLTGRQKVVAEFMLADDLGTWSKKWRTATIVTMVGTVLTVATQSLPSWIVFLPMVVAGFMAAPVLGGSWQGFKGTFTSGFILPVYASFPLGYGEISRVMLKTNLIRIVTWAPLAIVYAAALARRLGYSFEYGSLIGLDVVLLLLVLQPLMAAGHFSSGTNDTRQLNWHTFLFFGGALVLLVSMLVAAFMMFIVPTLLVQALAVSALLAMSTTAWAAYKWLLEHGQIDLLSRPSTQ